MSFESGTTDAREARIIALQSEINELCRRHGEAEQIRLPTRRNHRLQPPAAHSPKMPCAREAFNRSIIESSVNCIKGLDLEGNLLAMLNLKFLPQKSKFPLS